MKANHWLTRISPVLNNLWRGVWKKGTVEPGRYLYDHELIVVSRGNCRVRLKENVYELSAGSFLIIPPGQLHSTTTLMGGVYRNCFHFDWCEPDPRRKPRSLWVYHPNLICREAIKPAPAFVPHYVLRGCFDATGPVLSLVETLFHRQRSEQEVERGALRFPFGELLMRLLWTKPTATYRENRGASLAYRVKELLDTEDDSNQEPIQRLLPTLGFSYAHLCREFQRRFGISPARYRNVARLENAKEFLCDPKRTIAEAAYAAGFRDPAYFSRKFHECYGFPPSRLR